MSKAILLIRVSTQHQDLTQQTEKVKAEAIKDGFTESNIIILEDKESAVKLSEEERNGLNNLKWHIEHDDISCVYAYEISRISRQPSTLYSIRDYLIKHHVQLIILNPYMKMLKDDGSLSETANIFFGIFSSMAENEGFIRKARMRRGVEKKKAMGLHAGGPLAIGYTTDSNDKIIIDEDGAAIVRRIFNDYANGVAIRPLAKQLQAEGWRPNTAFLTICQSLLNILHREYYCGDKWHPQIISRELFNKCRDIAKHRTVNHVQHRKEALLKGLIYDKETGYLLSSNMCNKSMTYYCKRYGSTTISMKAADSLVSGVVNEWYSTISQVKIDEIRQAIKNEIGRQKLIVKQQEDNITKNQDKIDRITEMYIDGKYSKERADAKQKQIFSDLQYYKRTLDDARNKVIELTNELNNTSPNVHTMRDKVLYVVDKIIITRLSRFVCELTIINKWTGEQRIFEYNTRTCTILKMRTKTRPTLQPPK